MLDATRRQLLERMTHRVPTSVVAEEELRAHARGTQSRQLLISAVHVTGDLSLLDRFESRLQPSESGQAAMLALAGASEDPPEVRAELIDILCSVLTREDQPEYLQADDPIVFERLATVSLGEPVDPSQIPMSQEQCGFVAERRAVVPKTAPPETVNLAIVGAGMTGLDAAVKAAGRGFEYTIFDLEPGIGGLWWSQTYPGVAVDTPSIFYSLSYELSPEWNRYYPSGEEYREYLHRLADKYDVAEHVQCNSQVLRMDWIELDQTWELTIRDTVDDSLRTVRAAAVLAGVGHLNRPKYPNVPGRESFEGEQVHTARWRDLDLEGKRVAVVGVGAAGIQVIGAIAPSVEHLTVFQRQAHYVFPNPYPDGRDVPESERWLRRHLPYYLHWSRFRTFHLGNAFCWGACKVDYEWMKTHPMSISPGNDVGLQATLRYIHDTFGEGSELARKLTPDFAFNGKRLIGDPGGLAPGGYYWAYLQPHVDLIIDAITEVVPQGIVTADGTLHEVDVIIWATGMTLDYLSTIEIVGRDERRLADVWAGDNPQTYLGGTVPGFPNLFVNDGPNTGVATGGLGHNFMTETVNHYAFECLQLMVERGAVSIEVTQEAHDAHNERIDELMQDMIWTHERSAHNYYRNPAGRIVLPSPFHPSEYWTLSQRPEESAFALNERAADLSPR